MTLLTTLGAGAVIFLIGAIVAIGVRPREEDIAAARKQRDSGDGGGTVADGGSGVSWSSDSCGSDGGGDGGGGCGGD